MIKQAPSTSRILAMAAFAASCVVLLIFLWTSFGGSIPFAAQGYRFSVEFQQAIQLANQSDVRISGVSVGKVVSLDLDRKTGLTRAVLQIDRRYAPRPADTRAILRQKSLLGETYVELTPGSDAAPKLPDGGTLASGQVAPTVQLDQILSTFDPTTRRAFQVWMTQGGIALTSRGADINAALYHLYPFATSVESVVAVLNREAAATTVLIHDGGQTFAALTAQPGALQSLVVNSNRVFAATAAQNQSLAATIQAFPRFLVETRATVNRVTRFAAATEPLVTQLQPAAVQLSPALIALSSLAPQTRNVMVDIGPLTSASTKGVPALERFLTASVPWLTRLTPYLGGVVPVINYLNDYKQELAAFLANGTAATQARQPPSSGVGQKNYIRTSLPVNPEVLTSYQTRLTTNRGNPYLEPGGYNRLSQGLPVFGSYLCTNNPIPAIGPTVPADLQATLQTYYYTNNPAGPPCIGQPPLGSVTTGQLQAFPHLTPLP